MKRATVAVSALAVAGILLVLFVLPMFTPGFGGNMSVQLYNEGVPVGLPLAWTAGGEDCDAFDVTITWQVTATDYVPESLIVNGLMEVYDVEYIGEGTTPTESKTLLDSHTWASHYPSGTEVHMWDFATLLDTSVKNSWELRIYGHLEGLAVDDYGNSMDDECDLGYVTLAVTWTLDTGTFRITGAIGL